MVASQIRIRALVLAGLACWGGVSHADVEYNPQRYQVILDRSPFGEDPLDAEKVAEQQAAVAAQALSKDIRLCFLLESQTGEVRAGFQNLKPKAGDPKSVMLLEGESFNGMKLLDIDLEGSSATLQFKGKPISFTLSKAPAAARPAAVATKAPTTPTRRFGNGFRQRTPPPAPPTAPPLSPEEQARLREETKEKMREYQMEVIRAGMPPLPVPLTQEMDDQLVSEGVLPPSM